MTSLKSPVDPKELFGPGVLFLMAVNQHGDVHPVGTAFIICSQFEWALALTASHNVDFINKLRCSGTPFERSGVLPPGATGSIRDIIATRMVTGSGWACRVSTMVSTPDHDVALIRLDRTAGNEPFANGNAFALKFTAPPAGARVIVVGSDSHKVQSTEIADDCAQWEVGVNSRLISANVLEAYWHKPGLTKGPCFEVTADFPPGLSGSPVIQIDGQGTYAVGVVSSDSSHTGIATASMLMPALCLPLPLTLPDMPVKARLFDLVRAGIVQSPPSHFRQFSLDPENENSVVLDPDA